MCNHSSIDGSPGTRYFPAVRLWMAPAVCAVLCFPVAAQTPSARSGYGFYVDEFDTMYQHSAFDKGRMLDFDSSFPTRVSPPPSPTPLVSVDQLRHPLTGRAHRLLVKALGYAGRGDHAHAISTLREGMVKESALAPYAHGLLGVEYLRLGRNAEAIPEFTEAVNLFPHDPVAHSNFAVSLCVAGQFDRAERETKLALYLDPSLPSAQELMRMIEAAKSAQARSTAQ